MGHSTDSAAFQLAAAGSLMTATQEMFKNVVMYLTLEIGESKYSVPYLGYLPPIVYLDYDHELRLLLKCLKCPTLDLTVWPGLQPTIVSIEHLKELQTICNGKGNDLPFTETDLLFARYLDQNCDATLKIMQHEIADLLDQYVISSNGTSLYIQAVSDLMAPFIEPCSNPCKIQLLATKEITVFCLWKRILKLKKANINASKGGAQNPTKRGKFVTAGCYKTAEILFAAVNNLSII